MAVRREARRSSGEEMVQTTESFCVREIEPRRFILNEFWVKLNHNFIKLNKITEKRNPKLEFSELPIIPNRYNYGSKFNLCDL